MILLLQLTYLVERSIKLVIPKATQRLQNSPFIPFEHQAGLLISTHVNVCFTSDAGPSRLTKTGVRIDSILTAEKGQ